ncbi:hypothetical protein HJFPF1_11673 [Paramyrothecium foliicola]|nr:hypothetical protein HJFPF1_11673 [Paramyrothecium foliicola]
MRFTVVVALAQWAISASASPTPGNTDLEARNSIQKRSFWSSCRNCDVTPVGQLICECRQSNGNWRQIGFPLNDCLSNQGGVLHWQHGGNFMASCHIQGRGNPLWKPLPHLSVYCGDGRGGQTLNLINLDQEIHNWDGQLICID